MKALSVSSYSRTLVARTLDKSAKVFTVHASGAHPGAYYPMMELRGKRVLITGASRGIGEALAHGFAGAGANVALVARTQSAIEALAVELGGSAHAADLADPTQVAGLI